MLKNKYNGLGSREHSLYQKCPIQNGSLMALWPRLFGFARTLCRSDEDAEDITAEAVFKVWKAMRKKTPKFLPAYAMQAVRMAAYDFNERWDRPFVKYGFSIQNYGVSWDTFLEGPK